MRKKTIILYILLALICVFLSCLSMDYDFDLYARLIVGQRFIEDGILPFKDFMSYTPTHVWYDHEWGSSVVFYSVLKFIGPVGFLLLQALLMLGTAIFVIKTQRLQKHAYPTSLVFMSIFLFLFMQANPALIRCHLFSFFFFSMFLYILEKERKQSTGLIRAMPFIVIVWNNLHGGVVSGLGLIFMYIVGDIFQKDSRNIWKRLLAVLVLSTSVLIINPYGYKYLDFLFSAATKNREYITEWWSVFSRMHFLYYLPCAIYVVLAFLCNVINIIKLKKINLTKTIVLFVTLYLGLAHVKLIPVALIAAAALCYNEFCGLVHPIKAWMKKIEKSVYLVIIVMACFIPLSSPLHPRASLYKFPLYEIEFLLINNIKGNIVAPFGLGSYAAYKLYPNNLIFIDGRYEEVYYDKEFLLLRNTWLAESNWQDIYKNYQTDIIMPPKTDNLYEVLKSSPDWVHIFDGRLCGIFVKKGMERSSYLEPEYGLDYYRRTMFCSKSFGCFK